MSTKSAAVLTFGLGFIASDLFKIGIALTLARWGRGQARLRADELP